MKTQTLALLVLLSAPVLPAQAADEVAESRAGLPAQDELFRTVAALDTELFDAYNRCDLQKFASFFVSDVEFHHDKGGLTLGVKALTDSVKSNICGKVRRDLVPGTLRVFPMKDGALQLGVHRFDQPGHPEQPAGEGQFVHLWQRQGGAWKLVHVISYDHRELPRR